MLLQTSVHLMSETVLSWCNTKSLILRGNEVVKITEQYNGYETHYPILLEVSNKQLEKQLWFASKIRVVEEDRMEMLYKLDKQQQIGRAHV